MRFTFGDRLLPIARAAAGYRTRWRLAVGFVALLTFGLLVDAFWLRHAPPPSLTEARMALDKAHEAVAAFSIPRLEAFSSSLSRMIARITEARETLEGSSNADDVRATLGTLRISLDDVARELNEQGAGLASDWHRQVVETDRSFRGALAKLNEAGREIDQVIEQNGHWGFRLRADLIAIFTWLTPLGTIVSLIVFVLLFLVPTAELLKPFSSMTTRLRGLTIAGLRIDFPSDQVRSDKAEIQYALGLIRTQMRGHYQVGALQYEIGRCFSKFIGLVVKELNRNPHDLGGENEFRATIHVPFYFGEESVIQLLDYFDVAGQVQTTRPGAGRIFSIRRGIIGRAWRENIARYDPSVSHDPDALVSRWGMTRGEAEEAAEKRRQKTFLAVRLLDTSKTPIAIVYMDASADHLFDGPNRQDSLKDEIDDPKNIAWAAFLEARFQEAAKDCGLVLALESLRDSVGWDGERRLFLD